jgi:hypothetical protein
LLGGVAGGLNVGGGELFDGGVAVGFDCCGGVARGLETGGGVLSLGGGLDSGGGGDSCP